MSSLKSVAYYPVYPIYSRLGNDDGRSHSSPQRIRFEVLLEPVVRAVDCGSRHTAVVTESGRVFMCGNNFNAQLGYDFKTNDYKQHQVRWSVGQRQTDV